MINLTASTRIYALLGHPVGHSFSPCMQNAAFQARQLDAAYLALDVPPNLLGKTLEVLTGLGWGGLNLTIPHKERVLDHLTRCDDSARLLGAVNTVLFTPEGPVGYNTDGQGFLRALDQEFAFSPEGKTVLILGLGGAGRAVALTLASQGIQRLLLANRSPGRTETLAEEVRRLFPGLAIECLDLAAAAKQAARADLIVQATSVGMRTNEPALLESSCFRSGQLVYDLIYNQTETPIMRAARQAGAHTANGLAMLLHQGACAFQLWTGCPPPIQTMRNALEKAVIS